jgi:hypothetical protein
MMRFPQRPLRPRILSKRSAASRLRSLRSPLRGLDGPSPFDKHAFIGAAEVLERT